MPDFKKTDNQTRERDFPYFRRLWNSIVVALLATSFIPLFVIGGGMYFYATATLKEKTLKSLETELVQHQHAIDQFLSERVRDLQLLASHLGPEALTLPGGLEKAYEGLEQGLPCLTDLGIIDAQGQHLAYVGPFDLLSRNYKDSAWFKAVVEKEVFISDVFLGFRQVPHFVLAVKEKSAKGFWIIRATMDTAYFDDIVSRVTGNRSGDAFLVNSQGLFQTNPRSAGRLMDPFQFRSIKPFEGIRVEENENKVYLMTWLRKVPWLCVVKFDRADLYQPLRKARNLGIFVFILLAMLIGMTVLLTTNYLVSRLETKRRSIRFLDRQLRQTSKMASSVELSSGLVREIRDALNNIDIASKAIPEVMKDDFTREETAGRIHRRLEQIRSQTTRIKSNTETFSKATRRSLPLIKDVIVNDILEDVLEIMDRDLHYKGIRVERRFQTPLPSIRSDPSHLHHVFQNLLLNAVHVVQKEGTVVLTTFADDDHVGVSVADDGPAFPQPIWKRFLIRSSAQNRAGQDWAFPSVPIFLKRSAERSPWKASREKGPHLRLNSLTGSRPRRRKPSFRH